ncbi:MAG: HNH endonuclease [Planctomycetota bacterium]
MVKNKREQQKIKLPKKFLEKLKAVTAKRAKTVIDHILEHGYVTTEELSDKYGYDHPPRAARDVREQGIPLETFRVAGTHGRKIAAYRFGEPSKVRGGKLGGRRVWPKKFKANLVETYGPRCAICFTRYEPRYLQIDHRVGYEVGGDPQGDWDTADFMLLCSSCNRAKSWSCEHCQNWKKDHIINVCQTCYWARPESYAHIALRLIRRLDITWAGHEVPEYDRLVKLSKHARKELPEFVKDVLRDKMADEPE